MLILQTRNNIILKKRKVTVRPLTLHLEEGVRFCIWLVDEFRRLNSVYYKLLLAKDNVYLLAFCHSLFPAIFNSTNTDLSHDTSYTVSTRSEREAEQEVRV